METVKETAEAFQVDTLVREYWRLTNVTSSAKKAMETIKPLLMNEIAVTGEDI